jgi:hypothetical protein
MLHIIFRTARLVFTPFVVRLNRRLKSLLSMENLFFEQELKRWNDIQDWIIKAPRLESGTFSDAFY